MTRLVTVPAILLLLLASVPGCTAWQATRLYASGTEALDNEQTEKAISDLERAAELWPESGEIQNHLGIAYLQADRRRDARDAFARAVALNCSNPSAKQNLAALEAELGR